MSIYRTYNDNRSDDANDVSDVKMPLKEYDQDPQVSGHMTRVSISLPLSSIAGLYGRAAKKFEEYYDKCERVSPKSVCWTPAGDLFVGCTGGQILQVC